MFILFVLTACLQETGLTSLNLDHESGLPDSAEDTDTLEVVQDASDPPVDTDLPVDTDPPVDTVVLDTVDTVDTVDSVVVDTVILDTVDTDLPRDTVDTDPPVDTVVLDTIVIDTAPPPDTSPPIDTAPPPDTSPPVDTAPPPIFPIDNEVPFASDLEWPESFDWDDVGHAFISGSLWFGHLTRIDVYGGESVLYTPPASGWKTWGVAIDDARRRVYTCAQFEQSGRDLWEVWVVDADTGVRLATFDMEDSGATAECRDFFVLPDGRAFVTDREAPWLHLLDLDAGTFGIYADHPDLGPGLWGSDGVTVTPTADALLIVRAKPPGIVRVSLTDPTDVLLLPTDPADFDIRAGEGADGAVMVDGVLWVAAWAKLIRVTPVDATWRDATVESFDAPIPGLTSLKRIDGEVWGLKGNPQAWTLGLAPGLPFTLSTIGLPP